MMNLQINCVSTTHESVENKYQAIKFDISKHCLIISFCDCFGKEITGSEISIEDAKKLAKIITTIRLNN